MSEKGSYQPELGQACFGQPWQETECPKYIIALLEGIREEVGRIGGNEYQRQFDPFDNWGDAEQLKEEHSDIGFEVWPYSGNDEVERKYNFKYQDIEISWYKHLGRGTSMNKSISTSRAISMFNGCLEALKKWDKKYMKEIGAT